MKKLIAAGVVVVGLVVGALVFEPWTLWTRSTLVEAAPTAPSTSSTAPASEATSAAPVGPVELAAGSFVSQEHETSGDATVLELPDGRRVLRVEGFSTSNGPDLEVWLSDRTAGGSWFKYDEGRHVGLGKLKATDGDHNYEIPADADLDGIRSVVIWCVRFDVAFGSAPLELT